MPRPVPALYSLSFRSPETSFKEFEGFNAAICHKRPQPLLCAEIYEHFE